MLKALMKNKTQDNGVISMACLINDANCHGDDFNALIRTQMSAYQQRQLCAKRKLFGCWQHMRQA